MEQEQTPEVTQEVTETEMPEIETQEESAEPQETQPQFDHERFNEVNEAKKRLEQENKMLREQFYRSYGQQSQMQQQAPQHVFDADTDSGISRLVAQQLGPLQRENTQLKAAQIVNELSKDPDWAQIEPEVTKRAYEMGLAEMMVRGDMNQAIKMGKTLASAVKAEMGLIGKQAKAQADRQQLQRAAAQAPKGGADRKSEKTDFSKMSYAERKAYRSKLKSGQM